ncbi:uncharacterized protein LOC135833153 [Planococcus citri]|uniref:uncharacterized protein LOC135833153 n=1 Tax=Planococcus citri TaxID=170843 RepID=UPI0031F84F71
MLKIFKKFVIYLLFLPHTFPQPIGTNDSNDVEQLVQEEIAPVLKIFENFVNTEDKDTKTKLLQKGEFLGELMSLGRKAIKADMLLENLGALKTEKERSDLYRVPLGIGHRVDQLEELLSAGSDIVLGGERDKRWIKILELDTPIVKEFRDRIVKGGLDVNSFAKSVQQICPERNDRAGYGDVSLPEVLQENSVIEILKMMKIPKDQNNVITLQLLISPLTLPTPNHQKQNNNL